MTEPDAETSAAVLDAAKYLRDVRPLDPAELADYVPGGAAVPVVRTVLRDHAYELRVRERDDGRFVPIDPEPVVPSFDGVDTFPERYEAIVREALTDRYGPEWADGDSGDGLRGAIRGFKSAYFAGEPVSYDRDTALGYAIYHLPSYYAAVQYVIDELAQAECVPRRLRVLDVGAGVGGPALGIHDYLDGLATVRYDAIEPSAATTLLRSLLGETGRNFSWTIHETTVEEFEPEDTYDLVVLANVISELDEPVGVLSRLADCLAEDGSVVCLAPADRRTSLRLREVERRLVDDRTTYTLFGPTLRLWEGLTPTDECWSFDEREPLAVPDMQRQLDQGARAQPEHRDPATGEFVHTDVRFSYAILRTDGRRRVGFRATRESFVPFADSNEHVTNRIDVAAVKLSRALNDGSDHRVYRLGDGSQRFPHFGVVTRETSLNRELIDATYGVVLAIEGGLLLWNDDEAAFNLVIDEETVVDRIGPPPRTPPSGT